jgi:hypothetical protein
MADTITVNDGTADRTFTVVSADAPRTILKRLDGANTPAGFPVIMTGLQSGTPASGVDKSDYSVALPIVRTIDGAEVVVGTARFKGQWIIPHAATAAERVVLDAYVQNGLADTGVEDQVKLLIPFRT